MSVQVVPGPVAATLAIARVTLLRLLRGRSLWVGFVIAGLPLLYALALKGRGGSTVGDEQFVFATLVLSVLAPMFIASSVGEEIEERTLTYLWSRPVPRWSVLAGKLLALCPLALAIVIASWTVSVLVTTGAPPPLRTCVALAVGALAMSTVATGMATLSPRHGLAFSIVYLLFFDIPVGVLPATIAKISMSYQIRALSGVYPKDATTGSAVIALLIIGALWSLLAAWRIRRLEA